MRAPVGLCASFCPKHRFLIAYRAALPSARMVRLRLNWQLKWELICQADGIERPRGAGRRRHGAMSAVGAAMGKPPGRPLVSTTEPTNSAPEPLYNADMMRQGRGSASRSSASQPDLVPARPSEGACARPDASNMLPDPNGGPPLRQNGHAVPGLLEGGRQSNYGRLELGTLMLFASGWGWRAHAALPDSGRATINQIRD